MPRIDSFSSASFNYDSCTYKGDSPLRSCIKWLRQPGAYACLRKTLAIAAFAFLSMTVVGLLVAIPALMEWRRQDKEGLKISPLNLEENKQGPKTIGEGLAAFNNKHANGILNGLYVTTNETNVEATYQTLQEAPSPADSPTIHIGCAGWFNFDVMCARASHYGLIVDFNPANAEFIDKAKELLHACESRQEFAQAMVDHLNSLQGTARDLYFHRDQKGLVTDRIADELTRYGSWLFSDENYRHIKQMAEENRLMAITEDFTHHRTFARLKRYLVKNNIVVDTLYLSNICNFMRTDQSKTAFGKTITALLDEETIFINCPRIKHDDGSPETILHQLTFTRDEIADDPQTLLQISAQAV